MISKKIASQKYKAALIFLIILKQKNFGRSASDIIIDFTQVESSTDFQEKIRSKILGQIAFDIIGFTEVESSPDFFKCWYAKMFGHNAFYIMKDFMEVNGSHNFSKQIRPKI